MKDIKYKAMKRGTANTIFSFIFYIPFYFIAMAIVPKGWVVFVSFLLFIFCGTILRVTFSRHKRRNKVPANEEVSRD